MVPRSWPGRVARAMVAGATAAVLFVVVDLLGSATVVQWRVMSDERRTLEAYARQEPYRNVEWGRRYWEELARYRERWDPYWIYRVRDMRGEFINVADGVRHTYVPGAAATTHRHTVIVCGGSAVWGHGSRDAETLPSWLARVGEERGERLDVRNYAESGWVNWQCLNYLLERLTDGERPELVIFISGINETTGGRRWPQLRRAPYNGEMAAAAYGDWTLGQARPLARTVDYYWRTSLILRWLLPPSPKLPPSPPMDQQTLASRISRNYLEDRRTVEALGDSFGFSAMFVWQPTVADKLNLSPQELRYAGWLQQTEQTTEVSWWVMDAQTKELLRAVKGAVVAGGTVELGDVFHGMEETAFIDWMHPSETGNEKIARALYDHVESALHSVSRGTH